MQQLITAKLKLNTTPGQHQALRQTQLAYRDALNFVSRYAFEDGKMSSAERLQHIAKQGTPRNAIRGWISHRSTCGKCSIGIMKNIDRW
jgi:predicted transposase